MILLLLVTTSLAFAQENTGRSKKGSLLPKKEVPITITAPPVESGGIEHFTPFLVANIEYSEPSGNSFLDANEEATIKVVVSNIGKMPAENCEIKLFSSPLDPNIAVGGLTMIPTINPNEAKSLTLTLKANDRIGSDQKKFTLQVLEKNGFDLYPEKVLIVPTRRFQPPKLEVVDYSIEDQNRNMKIEKTEKVEVTIRIQNKGEAPGKNAKVQIKPGDNVLALDIPPEYELGDLKSGDYKDIKAVIATNTRATEVKLDITVTEGTGKYATEKIVDLPFDVVQKKLDEMVVAKGEEKSLAVPEAKLSKLDIAEDIPVAKTKNESGIAVIIGNRDYEQAPHVEFALNDAAIMKNYVVSALGYKDENVIYLENAKQSDMVNIFGNESNFKGRLYDFTRKGLSDVFIYYSGHGAPDPNSKTGFLVPVDCDPNRVSLNGYSLGTLYQNLDKMAADKQLLHVTLVLDACFSGNSEKGSLLKNISPIYLTVEKQGMTFPQSTVFTSASGDQVSTWYADKKQSLFTYFFLRGLKGDADINKDGIITAEEVYQYTADEVNGVPYWARRINNGRMQNPTFTGKDYPLRK